VTVTFFWAPKVESLPGAEENVYWLNHWHYRCAGENQDHGFERNWRLAVRLQAEEE
jgi:hypothetical protein